ncbi:MAG: hypothetical protein VX974_13615 [Pseudomonadota bacterium]|nr:hypothetical protein [Pseudomonadota bacterium]
MALISTLIESAKLVKELATDVLDTYTITADADISIDRETRTATVDASLDVSNKSNSENSTPDIKLDMELGAPVNPGDGQPIIVSNTEITVRDKVTLEIDADVGGASALEVDVDLRRASTDPSYAPTSAADGGSAVIINGTDVTDILIRGGTKLFEQITDNQDAINDWKPFLFSLGAEVGLGKKIVDVSASASAAEGTGIELNFDAGQEDSPVTDNFLFIETGIEIGNTLLDAEASLSIGQNGGEFVDLNITTEGRAAETIDKIVGVATDFWESDSLWA